MPPRALAYGASSAGGQAGVRRHVFHRKAEKRY